MNEKSKSIIQILVGLALIFVIVSYKNGLSAGFWLILCGVTGYLNVFKLLDSTIVLVRTGKLSPTSALFCALAVACSIAIVLCGYAAVLLLTTFGFFLLDWTLFRKRKPA